jgi:transposase
MSEKARRKPARTFTKEFKVGAAKMVVEQGLRQSEVCRDLDLNPNVLSRWVMQFRVDREESFPGKGKQRPDDERVRQLEKKLKNVTMERDILKKAMAYFIEVPK